MKTTTEVATEWYDKSSEILLCILRLPFLIILGAPYGLFWLAAKIYTKWFLKESK